MTTFNLEMHTTVYRGIDELHGFHEQTSITQGVLLNYGDVRR
jgi:hypothetical protein